MLLQTQLTDEMIAEALAQASQTKSKMITIVIGMICLFILLTAISTFVKSKRRHHEGRTMSTRKKILTVIVFLIPLCVFGSMVPILFMAATDQKEDSAHIDEWHVVETTISRLKEDKQVTKHRRKKANGRYETSETVTYFYYAYADGVGSSCEISKADCEGMAEGDAVYAIVDYEGNLADVYHCGKYSYTGERLETLK